MRRIAIAVTIGSAALAGASPAGAQTARMWFGDKPPTTDLTGSQRAFVRTYVSAITDRDVRNRKKLVHPASLACQRKENEDFFHELFTRHRGIVTPEQPPVTVESLPPKLTLFETFAKYGYRYPVRPTHAFYVDLVPAGPKQKSVVAFSTLHGGSWYEVLPCPTPEGLVAYRARKAQAAADDAAAQELARSLPDSVRAQIAALLRDGGRVAAMKKYAELSGQSLTVAKRVVELVESARR